MISHEYPPIGGGGANACKYLGKGFAELGHEVTLVTANFSHLENETFENGIHIYRVDSKREHKDHCSFSEMLSFIIKARPLVDKLERSNKYDVCLIFFGIPSGVLGYYLKKIYNLQYLIRFGGGDIPGFQDRFTKVYKIISPAIKLIWKNASARIANSEGLRQMAYRFCDKYPFEVIPNGVDVDEYKPNELVKSRDEDIDVLFVSRLIERKGLQFIIPDIKKIADSISKNIKFTIVGDGPYRDELQALVSQYGVEQYVQFVGHKDKGEIIPYYQQADIFILPSKKEGMPNVVLEAMSCGLPIIMTPCEGSKELVEGNGLVVNVKEFKKCIIDLSINDSIRKEMSRKSRERVVDYFSWNNTVLFYKKAMEKYYL